MKIWKNLLEPHIPDLHTFSIHLSKVARFSYLFNLLLRIGQILHTFSVSLSKFARLSYFFNLLKIWQTSIGKLSKIEEISESYFKMSNPLGAGASSGGPEGRSCECLLIVNYFWNNHLSDTEPSIKRLCLRFVYFHL